jgi:hypothetical protein
MARKNGTLQAKQQFLVEFAKTGMIDKAAVKSGRTRRTIYDWVEKDAAFKASYEESKEHFVELLETEADRRAVKGCEKPVFYMGEVVGRIREYSDTLLIFRLKALAPDKYRERQEITGKDGKPIQVETKPNLALLSDEELRTLETMLHKAADTTGSPSGTSPPPSP